MPGAILTDMKQKGPWQIKRSETKYENPWLTVREDSVIRPDGKPGIFGVATSMPGVCVLPFTEDGYVYITEEYRYGIEHNSIEAASGGMEDDMSALETAKKELQEETGLTAKEWIPCGMIDPLTSVMICPQYLFIAKDLTQGDTSHEGTEVITIHKIKFEELYLSLIHI